MLNKLRSFIRRYQLLQPGDHVVCAISGGADSVALLFAMYLMKESLGITIGAAHFNHGLRGEESDRDELFVSKFCDRLDIPLSIGRGDIVPGKKGLEAAARDARYNFLNSLSGRIATAHTADDNAETVLMHMVRGTGLKGLGGITPINGNVIRPMLLVTRRDVLSFLKEYNLTFVTDSSNESDQFLRNRLRNHVMPLLRKENPRLAENLSAMALRLREDEKALYELSASDAIPDVKRLLQMPLGLRCRSISAFLRNNGISEPESAHIELVNDLLYSRNPSAKVVLCNSVEVCRSYNQLYINKIDTAIQTVQLVCPGKTVVAGYMVECMPSTQQINEPYAFSVIPKGKILLRCRNAGDSIRLPGGTKSLKKLFIDRKIPATERNSIPVLADDEGILGVCGIGANLDRIGFGDGAVEIRFANTKEER